MKKIASMLLAALLSLFSLYSTCCYSISSYIDVLMPLMFAAIISYMVIVYFMFRKASHS